MSTELVKSMSPFYIDGGNISMYRASDGTVTLYADHVDCGCMLGRKAFPTQQAAEDWYAAIPGTGVDKLDNALRILMGLDESEGKS